MTKPKLIRYLLVVIPGVFLGIYLINNKLQFDNIKKPIKKIFHSVFQLDKIDRWNKDFLVVKIKSHLDNNIQKAYFYKVQSDQRKPLVVSLHSWSGDFSQADDLALLCKMKNVNYIHPDFRGKNLSKDACCSKFVLGDIDDAITYAIENSNVDTSEIYVIGVSGGGYATLGTFMKSRHKIKKFSAWAPITDLISFYHESKIRGNQYANYILLCTESKGVILNEKVARQKSPIYWDTPKSKIPNTKILIYAGVNDGINGSVPISHSINFYNKLLTDLSVKDSAKYVSENEKQFLFKYRKPVSEYGSISDRKVCLIKEYSNIKLVIFEGGHEFLPEYALDELLVE